MKTSKTSRASTRLGLGCAIALGLLWSTATTTGQTFTTIRHFGSGVLGKVAGLNLHSRLAQGLDGTLYGTASEGEGDVRGTLFKMQPDGSNFTVLKWFTNSVEGANPGNYLAVSGSVLYGTTYAGGNSGGGTIFKVNTDGTAYAVLKHFGPSDIPGNPNAAAPGTLTLSGNTLYGTSGGGNSNYGTVFKVNTDGTGFAVLKDFTGNDGSYPSGLTFSGNMLYGTTYLGGDWNQGTVFKLDLDGTDYTVIKHFTGGDAANPLAGLTMSGNTLYGTASSWESVGGGVSGAGAVFKVNTDGTGYTVLKRFEYTDGAEPTCELVLSGDVLYGTTGYSGSSGAGTVFKVHTDGTGFTVLHCFNGTDGYGAAAGLTLSGSVLYGTKPWGGSSNGGVLFRVYTDGTGFALLKEFTYTDGRLPSAGLTLSGSTLYGTTAGGGGWGYSSGRALGYGTVFKVNTDGTGYTILKHFAGSDGAYPYAALTLSGEVLYGTTESGGSLEYGTVFQLNADGTGYTVIHDFSGFDGQGPRSALILSNGVLYGTTGQGGNSGDGTVFKLNIDGTGYKVLKHVTPTDGISPEGALTLSGNTLYGTTRNGVFKINTDGTGYAIVKDFSDRDGPLLGLTLSANVLYGTTKWGGSFGYGTVFKMNTDGTGYMVLKHFAPSDAAPPSAGLALCGGVLYGTGYGDGLGPGTVFKLNTDGTGYTVLKQFSSPTSGCFWCISTNSDGASPEGELTLSGNTLYGTAYWGGNFGFGTLFKIELSGLAPIPLAAQASSGSLILSWSNPAFALQAAPDVTGIYTNIPCATSPYTNTILGTRAFFRLIGPSTSK